MAKDRVGSFNFGFNKKPNKQGSKKKKPAAKKTGGRKNNRWREYVSAPIPD
jgi:hypothetical protein